MNLSRVDIVAEFDEDGDLEVSEVESGAEGTSGLSVQDSEPEQIEPIKNLPRQARLARFIFDCKKIDDERFSDLLVRGLELFGRTEVDVVKTFAVRLERAEAWTFGSDVPLPQMRDNVIKWLVGLAETEIDSQGAEYGR